MVQMIFVRVCRFPRIRTNRVQQKNPQYIQCYGWHVFLKSVAMAGFDLQKEVELMLGQKGHPPILARYVTVI